MSSINVNTIKSRLGGPPTLPSGVVVSAAAVVCETDTVDDVAAVGAVAVVAVDVIVTSVTATASTAHLRSPSPDPRQF